MKKKILIIDDETSTLEMLWDFLHDEFDVTLADNLVAGTRILLEQPCDVLLLDVRLPGMETYHELQALLSNRFMDLPVLMSSADRMPPPMFVLGPKRAYLPKPLRPTELQGALQRLCTPV